jgi:transketolase
LDTLLRKLAHLVCTNDLKSLLNCLNPGIGVHGSPLGPEAIAEMKAASGMNPAESFVVPESVRHHYGIVADLNKSLYEKWQILLSEVRSSNTISP